MEKESEKMAGRERKRRRESEKRENYVRENVIECKHTSKHSCMKSLVNNFK